MACLFALIPGPSLAVGLDCTFTTICSPMTDCQTHPGVPFQFETTEDGISFMSASGMVLGTRLPHLAPPTLGLTFAVGDTGTLLLTVSTGGSAAFTQQDILPTGAVQSVSYFGTCEPAT